ncbi:putative quinol monooxygenase [Sphingomonas sp. PB4P5]|uniref:putative quinol monooxygenase n=1 Tax=Parasphingomonas puruogangriensis TaxID=3096155 RepID=UPI002FC927B1
MLIVTGTMSVPPTDLADFVAALRDLAVATRRRDGNLSYDAAILDASAGQLLVVERWRDQAALSAHLTAEDTTEFVRRWQDRMSGDIRKYDATNERPLSDE